MNAPDWWTEMCDELERRRVTAAAHQRTGDPQRWATTNALARHHEGMCIALLRHHGWVADHWGQALISDDLRDALRLTQCPARWSPDILAVRGCEWVLLDCKTETRMDTPNFSIEMAALDACFAWSMASTDPNGVCGFVWHDFSWSPAAHVHLAPKTQGPHNGNGSRTPYWLVPKTIGLAFRDHFAVKQVAS
jgi:hypothetical protein